MSSATHWGRPSGGFERHCMTSAARGAGKSGRSKPTGTGSSAMTLAITPAIPSPTKGRLPAKSS